MKGVGGDAQGVAIVRERRRETLWAAVSLHISGDGATLAVVPLVQHRADLDEALELVANVDVAGNSHRAVVDLPGEASSRRPTRTTPSSAKRQRRHHC